MDDVSVAVIVDIKPTKVWMEKDLMGTKHIYMQHEDCEKFEFITINYHHHYTCNSHQHSIANAIMKLLGGSE